MFALKWMVPVGSFIALFLCLMTIMAMERMIVLTDYIYGNISNSSFPIYLLAQREDELLSNNTLKSDITHPFDMCVLPKFDPWDQNIIPFVNLNYNPLKNCNRNFIPMTTLKNGILSSTTENHTCWGRCLGRISDKENSQGRWVNIDEADFRCDIVESLCNNSSGEDVYQMVHAQIIERVTKKKPPKSVDGTQYNVYVILIDSTSSSQGIRNLPRTIQYLEKSMMAVTFPYINKVGLNSRPNGVALWFGKRMEKVDRSLYGLPPLEEEWNYDNFCHRFIDNETFLMKEFTEYGYKTLLAEDWMKGTLNWPNCKGFNKQPTDHYMRPFQVALEKKPTPILRKTYSKENCIEQHQDILRYLTEFVNSYNGVPKFGWIWLSLLSHDHESGTIHADGDFHEFLLRNKEKLDESFIIILGDHGLRGGKVTRTKLGELEMSNPLFSISVPKSLRRGNDIISILQANSNRLQTHFDIRATLLDLLKYQPSSNFTDRHYMPIDKEHGSSLLRYQGVEERTCKNLPIPPAYCTCQYTVDRLNSTSEMAHKIGKFVLQYINKYLSDKNMTAKCQILLYNETISLSVYSPANLTNTYQIVVKANEPSNGEFKAMVRRTAEDSLVMASPTIDRMDRFGNHGICATDRLKHLCYCLDEAATKKQPLPTDQSTHYSSVQTSSLSSQTRTT